MWVLSALAALGLISIVGMNFSEEAIEIVEESVPAILIASIGFGVAGIVNMLKIRKIMPVFMEYSYYAIPASVLIIIATFSEYFESSRILENFGVSETQILYITHFLLYGAISLLLVGFGKLKKPMGIYKDM